jgi:hypothetical protein
VTSFSTAEISTIRSGISSQLAGAYSGYNVSFVETNPGGSYETIYFGQTHASYYGDADGIDYRNQSKTDTARVYTANLSFILDEFSGSENRSTQIDQLTTALAGTASHELAHNLGLRHHDAYGEITFTGSVVSTDGSQNTHLMATGSTGLSEVERETARAFSLNSDVKLAYADGLLDSTPSSVLESGDAGNTAAAAQAVSLTPLSNVARDAANIIGSLSAFDFDYYSLALLAGTTLTADINYAQLNPNPVDTILRFYGPDGITLLGENDDTLFNGDTFGSGTYGGTDSIFFNFPIAQTGTYYVRVSPYGSDTGDYELLLHTTGNAVPEPATWISLIGLAATSALLRARRRRRRGGAMPITQKASQ